MINIRDFDAFCFDLDGTIYVGNQLLPGVKETIGLLRQHQKSILFITNAPTQTREGCQKLLTSLGVAAQLEEVLTASFLSAAYFLENCADARIFIVGERALLQEFSNYSLHVTANPLEATHVLVGLDRDFSYQKLNRAMRAVRNGAKLIVTNPDPSCPVSEGYIADTFAIAKAIEVAAGHPIDLVIGKPSSYYARKVSKQLNIANERCLIIGDRLETDILMGKANQFRTCLVLTGASSKADINKIKIKPDYVIENLTELFTK
ncbi:HAD-IIA family hydrolase [Bacillus xiapuensis]|uniref:HAD-IIA family hydrolase n=1 Tax=Bacillus xiapuensis TaxID=2014075 RepID=UPI000C241262|nr:HAD-IIA family hydrolase [Bacillus xiapuensis]